MSLMYKAVYLGDINVKWGDDKDLKAPLGEL